MPFDETEKSSEVLDRPSLVRLVAEIVSAYVSHNLVRVSEIPEVIRTVAASLQVKGEVAEKKPEPAVPVRKSVTQDYVVCLVCGKKQRTLKRHLSTAHGLSPAAYREQFGLSSEYPMVAPAYASVRSEMAKKIGLGRKRRGAEPEAQPQPEPQPEPETEAQPAPRRRRSRGQASA